MNKIKIIGFLSLLSFSFVWADTPLVIELQPGRNEVSLKILNKSNLDLQSICVIVKAEDLPEGLSMLESMQKVDISPNSTSNKSLLLQIEVNEKAKAGVYQIPFQLKDKFDHTWDYDFTAELKAFKPEKYELAQNYPNPFNLSTKIDYSLANDNEQETSLVILDLLGRQIRTLVKEKQPAGSYTVIWDGKDESGHEVASGVYFCKLTARRFVKIIKISLTK